MTDTQAAPPRAHDTTCPATPLTVHLDQPARVITARGELDFATAPMLTNVMATLIEHNPGDSTLNLAELTFIDAAGIGCVVGFAHRLIGIGAAMTIDGATPRLRHVFAIVDLAHLLEPE